MNIGLFDSGLGGLTILRAIAKALPEYDYSYYGDTANLPYGDKTEAEIYAFSEVAMRYLFEQGSVLVIIACNTASAETLRKLQDEFLPTHYPDRKILGVVIPTVEVLIEEQAKDVLLLATRRTIDSSKYDRELATRDDTIILTSVPTAELVPLIEAGNTEAALAHAITVIVRAKQDRPSLSTVVLGCTHYTELKEGLRQHYGSALTFVSQDEIVPNSLRAYLGNHPEIATKLTGSGKRSIHLTEHRPDYDKITAQLLRGAYLKE